MTFDRGFIFLHKNFTFKDGSTGEKYLILLNSPQNNEPCLLVKTTSQKRDKPEDPGCIEQRSLYFFPARKTFFHKGTWVQLYELYEMRGLDNDPDCSMVSSLESKAVDRIIDCLFLTQRDDITDYQERLLRPSGFNILDLKKRFEKFRP